MDGEKRIKQKTNPHQNANFISTLFFLYMIPIFWKGFRKGLTEEDLYEPQEEDRSKHVSDKLEFEFQEQYKKYKKWALHIALLKVFRFEFVSLGLCNLAAKINSILVPPLLIQKLVTYFTTGENKISTQEAYMYAGFLVLSLGINAFLVHPPYMWNLHTTMKIRVACSSLIYRKALRLNVGALRKTTVGHMVNLLSNDVTKFDRGCKLIHCLWITPIQTAIGTYLLYQQIGISSILGVAFFLFFIPIQMYIGKKTSILRLRTALRTDERVRLINEIISGIQVIKMYTWEKPFAKLVFLSRRKEIQSIRANKYLNSIIYSMATFVGRVANFISLIAYVMFGNSLTASKVFSVTAIFNALGNMMSFHFAISISAAAEMHVSIKRIADFLSFEELHQLHNLNQNTKFNHQCSIISGRLSKVFKEPKVILRNVSAKWTEVSKNTIKNINFTISQAQIFAITGPTGSGKTSLMNVILKELSISSGELEVNGSISYSAQEPWLFNESVRYNILFGDMYDEERYKEVCKVCALELDFALLPYGDKSLVGETGKALSGGQKARISLARCVYKKADIYLLDNPLSAVDANVGKQVYRDCIETFLKDKIVILITYQLQYLKNADNILMLNDGSVTGEGKYEELQSSGLDFTKLLDEFETGEEENVKRRKSRQDSLLHNIKLENSGSDYAPTIAKENLGNGKITLSNYISYLRAGGSWIVISLVLASFIITQIICNFGDYYLTYCVNFEQDISKQGNQTETENTHTRNIFIYQYSGIILAIIIMSILHSIVFFIFLMRSSVRLHNNIFVEVLNARLNFFSNNPSGRILNRFSKDMDTIDELIPIILFDLLEKGLLLVGTIILTSVVNLKIALPLLCMMSLFYFLHEIYLKTSIVVKRFEGTKKSPVFSHIVKTMQGLSTIRAFSAEQILIKEFDQHQDTHSSAWYLFIAATNSFRFYLDLICVIFIGIILFIILSLNDDMRSGDLGLIITQFIGLLGALQWGIRQWCEIENQMTSVERVLEYTKLEEEPERDDTIAKVLPLNWPSIGKLEFKNLSMRYKINDPPVLKNLSFMINSGEKIGIVGRTGAGKSSIITALFQLYEVEGAILIDDVDTTRLPFDILRSKISIIPQEPVLFSGTMQKNLDPFDEYEQSVLWNALEQVELKEVIYHMPDGLSTKVLEGGTNFSVGQRQLICLARTIIRNNKILVLDEATANVDPHTDALIQKTIRNKFADCTVLTIAHRLHTVMDSDKILVMDAGVIVEFDRPHVLLQNKAGVLKSMVESTGPATAANLSAIAEKAYEESKNK